VSSDLYAQDTNGRELPGTRGGEPRRELARGAPDTVATRAAIPFVLRPEDFRRGTERVTVTIRIYNVLQQLVAVVRAVDRPDGAAGGEYTTPGRYVAYWDGVDLHGRRVPSGIYYYRIHVDGRPTGVGKVLVRG